MSSIIDTSYQITGLTGLTTYYWSVTASNLAGDSEASVTYSFTTAFPSSPIPLTPTFQQLDVDLTPQFTWHGDIASPAFRFQFSEGLGISNESMIVDTIISANGFQIGDSLKPGTFYAWRVNAQNSFGTSLWSKVFQFKTIVILPETPILVAPNNNVSALGDSIQFVWLTSQWALKYNFEIALDSTFSQIFYSQKDITDNFTSVTGFTGETKYYWRVLAKNNGGVSENSEVFNFTTGFPVLPVIIYPTYQQLDREIDPILLWSSTQTATDYWVQLSAGLNINLNDLIISGEEFFEIVQL